MCDILKIYHTYYKRDSSARDIISRDINNAAFSV